MKKLFCKCKINNLGKITIPKSIREYLEIEPNEPLRIVSSKDKKEIHIKLLDKKKFKRVIKKFGMELTQQNKTTVAAEASTNIHIDSKNINEKK